MRSEMSLLGSEYRAGPNPPALAYVASSQRSRPTDQITRASTSRRKTHGNIYFCSQNFPWGGQQRRVLAIQGKTPGSKPPTFFLVWAFFCLLRRRGVRAPVPQRLVRTPRASGRVAASPRHYLRTFTPSTTTNYCYSSSSFSQVFKL